MRLPAGGFHQFLGGDAAGPLQQVEDLGGLAAIAGLGLAPWLSRGLWALSWPGWPSCPTWPWRAQRGARRAPTRGLLVGFAGSSATVAGAVPVSSVVDVMMVSPFAVITAVTTWITPVGRKSKRADGGGRGLSALPRFYDALSNNIFRTRSRRIISAGPAVFPNCAHSTTRFMRIMCSTGFRKT